MSIPVPMARLAETLACYNAGVLITSAGDTWPRVLTVEPGVVGDDLLIVAPHPEALRNVAANPLVTVVWQPREPRGYTLIVDGWASPAGDDLRIRLDHAVLHRPGAHSDGPPPPLHLA